LMYLKNPLINRSIEVPALYVWALGVDIRGVHPEVNRVVQDFMSDPMNKKIIGTKSAYMDLDRELGQTGNLFFVFFVNKASGKVRIRTFDVSEIVDIYTNPEDRYETWFYKRSIRKKDGSTEEVWYPDIDFQPIRKPKSPDGKRVEWDNPVYHIKTGCIKSMKFGLPEPYSALSWAQAYREFLQNWATIMKAYAKVAMKMTGLNGKKGVAGAKETTKPVQTQVGATFLSSGVDISAVKTAGATTSAGEGRPLRAMVAAAVGLPETFFGDTDIGNYATSQTLDRPTELKMVNRQGLWSDVLARVFQFVVVWSFKAPGGYLRRELGAHYKRDRDEIDARYTEAIELPVNSDPEKGPVGEPISTTVNIVFPNILERNATERVRAIVGALTLLGKPVNPLFKASPRRVMRMVLQALGERDIDKKIEEFLPDGTENPLEQQLPEQTDPGEEDEEKKDDAVVN
jgi:hypothetical protein